MYQALYRKYRPRTFDGVVGQAHITETLKRQVESGRLSHAYLFTGTRGTGKTSCAKILTRAVNCEQPEQGNPCNRCPACVGIEDGSILDVLEIDAASNSGVDNVRALRDDAIYTPATVRRRVYIIDEVHMLSTQAFNALLKILEEPPVHLMFILATTELHKVPATIKSRCQQFAFKRITPGAIAALLSDVAGKEGLALTAEGAALLARLADGGMRDAFSLLDQCVGAPHLDEAAIFDALGMAGNLETARLMACLAAGNTADALETVHRLHAGGKDMKSLLGELSALARDLLVRKTAPRAASGLMTGGYDEATMRALGEGLTAPRLLHMMLMLQNAIAELARGGAPRTDTELCIIRLADETLDGSPAGLSARVSRLETLIERNGTAAPVAPAVKRKTVQSPPPPPDDDLPPWDMPADIEDEPEYAPDADDTQDAQDDTPPWEAPADAADEPEYAPPDEDAPAPAAEGGAPEDTAFWQTLLPLLRGKVPPQTMPFLSNPAMTSGAYSDGVLTLTASTEMILNMINKTEILSAIGTQAGHMAGCTVTARAVRRELPSAGDKLGDLLAFGQKFSSE